MEGKAEHIYLFYLFMFIFTFITNICKCFSTFKNATLKSKYMYINHST